jgi:hypothetical protein
LQPDLFHHQLVADYFALKGQYMTAHGPEKRELREKIAEVQQEIAEWAGTAGDPGAFDWTVEFAEVFTAPGGKSPSPELRGGWGGGGLRRRPRQPALRADGADQRDQTRPQKALPAGLRRTRRPVRLFLRPNAAFAAGRRRWRLYQLQQMAAGALRQEAASAPQREDQYVSRIPISSPTPDQRAAIEALVRNLLDAEGQGPHVAAWEQELDALVYQVYGLTEEEIALVEASTK